MSDNTTNVIEISKTDLANNSEGLVHRDCPLCGRAPPQTSFVQTSPCAESLSFEALVPHWNGFFKERVFFSYVRCQSCSLLYAPVFFGDEQLARLYAQMPPNMESIPVEALKRTQSGYFATMRRHSLLEGAYLEVGPDIGILADSCVREGRFDEYWLYEPNRAVERALVAVVGYRN